VSVEGTAIIKKINLKNILKSLIEKFDNSYSITLDEYEEKILFEKKSPYDTMSLLFNISDDEEYFLFTLGKKDIFEKSCELNCNDILKDFFNKIIDEADLWFYDSRKELKKWIERWFN